MMRLLLLNKTNVGFPETLNPRARIRKEESSQKTLHLAYSMCDTIF